MFHLTINKQTIDTTYPRLYKKKQQKTIRAISSLGRQLHTDHRWEVFLSEAIALVKGLPGFYPDFLLFARQLCFSEF